MQRFLFAIALILIFAVTGWSQDSEAPDDADQSEVSAAEDDESEAEDIDETGLDDQDMRLIAHGVIPIRSNDCRRPIYPPTRHVGRSPSRSA